jgi:aspartate/glutamate/aspartate-prephenate aminotransferase
MAADENGLTYKPEDVVVSNGAKQAIWQAIMSACSPGDEVFVLSISVYIIASTK